MAVTGLLFSKVFGAAFNKEIDLLDDDIRVTLHTVTMAPNQDTWDYADDLTDEVVGTGYTAGGQAIANDVFTYTAGTNVWMYDGDDMSWPGATITARYAVVKDNTPGTTATKPLILMQNFGADFTSSGGTFQLQWNASGIFTLTVA